MAIKTYVNDAWEDGADLKTNEIDGARESAKCAKIYVGGAWEEVWVREITLIADGVKNSAYVGSTSVNASDGSATADSDNKPYRWTMYGTEYEDYYKASIYFNIYVAMSGDISTSQYSELVIEYSLTKTMSLYDEKIQAFGQHPSYGQTAYANLSWGANQTVIVDLSKIAMLRNMVFYIMYESDMDNPVTFEIHNAYLR